MVVGTKKNRQVCLIKWSLSVHLGLREQSFKFLKKSALIMKRLSAIEFNINSANSLKEQLWGTRKPCHFIKSQMYQTS